MDDNRKKALSAALGQIEKQFGKGSVMRLGDSIATRDIDVVSTGSLGLDIALGIGGLPRGRIVEIYGPESSGKTTLTLQVVAEIQKLGGTAAFVDAEHALDPAYADKVGVNVDDLLISQPDTGEQALEITDMLVRSGAVDVIVVDSVAALTPKAEIEGEMGDSHMGLQARLMSQALRKLTGNIKRSNALVIFINQIRMKIGVMFGNPETTTGGNALKFYASVRLDIRRTGSIKKGEEVIGSETRVKVVKNKVAPPFKTAEFEILYGVGISREGEIVDLGVKQNIIEKSGAWYSFNGDRIGQGKENARDFLLEHKDIAAAIDKRIRAELLPAKKPGPVEVPAAAATRRRVRRSKPDVAEAGAAALDEPACTRAALELLARREHSRRELDAQARRARFSGRRHRAACSTSSSARARSPNARFTDSFVRSRIAKGQGPQRIRAELAQRGIADAEADDGLRAADVDWLATIRAVRAKRFGPELPRDYAERARQARFLQYRGLRQRADPRRTGIRRRFRLACPSFSLEPSEFSSVLDESHEQSAAPGIPGLFRQAGPQGRAELLARARQRPDAAVHERRHGAVQGLLPRQGQARLRARREQPALRARGRQAQRSRERRLHGAPPHVLRDARQLLVRRLLQEGRDPLRLGFRDGHAEDRSEAPHGHGLRDRRRGVRPLAQDDRAAGRRRSCASATTSPTAAPTISGRWATRARAARAARSSTTTARTSPGGPPGSPDADGDRWVEIWNLVFMQFDRSADGKLTPLPKPSVDTGAGLERMSAVMQGVTNNYEIDLFVDLIREAARLLGTDDLKNPSLRVIADHIRACSFLVVDGVVPSNEGRGYVLRRIARRAMRHGHKFGVSPVFFNELVPTLAKVMGAAYPELVAKQAFVRDVLRKEGEQFARTLETGMAILDAAIAKLGGAKVIDGNTVFKLHDTYGFPTDLTADIARERGLAVDMEGYERAMDVQRRQSQAASQFGADLSAGVKVEGKTDFLGYEAVTDVGARRGAAQGRARPCKSSPPATRARSCSTARLSMPRAAARSATRASSATCSARFAVSDTQKRGSAHSHHRQAHEGRDRRRRQARRERRRAAPRGDRAESLGDALAACGAAQSARAARPAERLARRARSGCASTSRTSSPSAPSSSPRSRRSSTSRFA